jgi:hypothetical protein
MQALPYFFYGKNKITEEIVNRYASESGKYKITIPGGQTYPPGMRFR